MKKKLTCVCFAFLTALGFVSCRNGHQQLFTALSADRTGIDFSNTITENDSVNVLNYYYCYNGGGVGIADFNNDGLQDIFFSGNMVSSRLYINTGKMRFKDVTTQAGVKTSEWIMGISVVDINNDGWMDIYLNVAGPGRKRKHHNILFINQGKAGGAVSFKEDAAGYGLADSSFCVQSAFFDYDRDGDLDMYLLTNDVDGVEKTFINPKQYPVTRGATSDKLYENTGDSAGHLFYRDVSKQAGLTEEGYGLGLSIGDLNGDGWPDVYAANDFMPNDQLLINQKNKTFKEVAQQSMRHQTYNGMGVDIADINNDLRPDIMVMDMLPSTNERRKTMIGREDYENFMMRQKAGYVDEYMRNTLQLNQGTDAGGITYFSDIAQFAGVHATDWSWSVLLADFDNDGHRDSYVTSGFVKNITDLDFMSYNQEQNMFGIRADKIKATNDLLGRLKGINVSNSAFRNTGDLGFVNTTEEWGLNSSAYSNGAAYADLDNDGDLDLVVNNINQEAAIYENNESSEKSGNNYLSIDLKGEDGNIHGIGSSVFLYCGKDRYGGYSSPVKGYLSSMTGPLLFGIGSHALVDSIRIVWPDGRFQTIKNIKANQVLEVRANPSGFFVPAVYANQPVFINKADEYGIHYAHVDNAYRDFNDEPLLPKLYSKKGPGISVGDIDGRNGADFFIGGSAGKSGMLFTQLANGKFDAKEINREDSAFEDMGSLIFDADHDGDQDLYVVSGGVGFKNVPGAYQDRLYINNGSGGLTKKPMALPAIESSGSCIVGADFDKDGDIDLFRGGANSPGSYPVAPRSYLLENDGGKFIDATARVSPALMNMGMVTSAVWSDFDNDGWVDLIVVGEWMSPVFLKNQQGRLVNVSDATGLVSDNGWWNSIYPVDTDNDGNIDFVLGNTGTNVDFKPSKNEPLELFYNKFSGSSRPQALISYYNTDQQGDRKRYPLAFRDDLFREMPWLKKKYWNYELYGKAGIEDIFKKDELSAATHLQADIFENCILKNDGHGKFHLIHLPAQAQLSCINGVLAADYNADGNTDLLVTGNLHSTEVVYGWLDASLGVLLNGDGKGNFVPEPAHASGLFLSGDMKSLASLTDVNDQEIILAAANSDSLRVLGSHRKTESKIFHVTDLDASAELTYKNGKTVKQELYYGGGYLSQSARVIRIDKSVVRCVIVDSRGKRRELNL